MADVLIRKDVEVIDAKRFVRWYGENVSRGPTYYGHSAVITGAAEAVGLADLGWAVLLAGRPSPLAAQSLIEMGPIEIRSVPSNPLHETSPSERQRIVDALVGLMLPGIASSIASKMLHPKRRETVPVLDSRAIFGSYRRPDWRPGQPITSSTVRQRQKVEGALEAVYESVSSQENQAAWQVLEQWFSPRYSRIELFDMIWWVIVQNPAQLVIEEGGEVVRCSLLDG